jgi:hypothetical protein
MVKFVTRTTNVVVAGALMITNITSDFMFNIFTLGTKVINVHMITYATMVTWVTMVVGSYGLANVLEVFSLLTFPTLFNLDLYKNSLLSQLF